MAARAFPYDFGWDAFCEACRTAQVELIFPATVGAGQEESGNADVRDARGSGPAGGEQPPPDDLIAVGAKPAPRGRKRPRVEETCEEAS